MRNSCFSFIFLLVVCVFTHVLVSGIFWFVRSNAPLFCILYFCYFLPALVFFFIPE